MTKRPQYAKHASNGHTLDTRHIGMHEETTVTIFETNHGHLSGHMLAAKEEDVEFILETYVISRVD